MHKRISGLRQHIHLRQKLCPPEFAACALRLASKQPEVDNDDGPGADRSVPKPSDSPTHWTDASTAHKHWLDRRLPGAREWLQDKNKSLWLQGIGERCRHYHVLEGRQDFIKQEVERRYLQLLEKYSDIASDDRAQTHLQMGCLMVATDKVLNPWLKDPSKVCDIIKAHMGEFTSPVLRFLLRYTLYLTLDPFRSTQRRLGALRLDYGSTFETHLEASDKAAELQVKGCFYQEFLSQENAEHLLSAACCSQDRVWFEGLEGHGIAFNRKSWKGNEDAQCCLQIVKVPKRSSWRELFQNWRQH